MLDLLFVPVMRVCLFRVFFVSVLFVFSFDARLSFRLFSRLFVSCIGWTFLTLAFISALFRSHTFYNLL